MASKIWVFNRHRSVYGTGIAISLDNIRTVSAKMAKAYDSKPDGACPKEQIEASKRKRLKKIQ